MTQTEGGIPTQNLGGNREGDLEGKNQRNPRKNEGDPVHRQALHQAHPGEEDLGAEGQKDPDLKAPDVEGRPKRPVEGESRAPRAENHTRLVKEDPGLEPEGNRNRRLQSTR